MGYYTNYKVKISGADNANQMIKIADALTLQGYDISGNGTTLTIEFDDKWYSWKEDFERVSRTYPRVLFEVNGIGEDKDDQWRARIRDGVSEIIQAKIIFDEFQKIK
jgi:hypothetical protein